MNTNKENAFKENNSNSKIKNEYLQAGFIIGISLLFVFAVMMSIQSVMGGTKVETSIFDNKAEEYYYDGKYDEAISEYTKLQKDTEWPSWTVKAAMVYSVKGDYAQSNNALKEAVVLRDRIVLNDSEKYAEEDKVFMNEVIFTFFMNKEYDQAISLGEQYILENGTYKPLMETMFTLYMANGEVDNAKEIIKEYPVDKDSAYDLAIVAKMQMLLGNYDEGIATLKKAWELNHDEVKVFDVITEVASYDKNGMLEKVSKLDGENPDDIIYKLLIAKIYSASTSTVNMAEDIINTVDSKEAGAINYDVIKAEIFINSNRESEAKEILTELIESEEYAYIGYYIKAWQCYNNGEYEDAFEYCKKSIIANKDYSDNYGVLIPQIMIALDKSETVEAYYRTALYKEPFNYNIMVKTGDYYAYTALKYDKAAEYYNLALSIKSDEAEIYYKLGSLYLLQDKVDDAIEKLEKAIELNSTNGKYYRTLGTVYLNNKENENAIEKFREAYAIDETDVLALNNAGCYYISIEEDVWRGYENIKAAYEEMPSSLDKESKDFITDNYNKAKKLYDDFNKGDGSKLIVPEFHLFY